jgi:DinB family protein
MSTAIGRPETTEFAEYYTGYISKVPGADILQFLQQQLATTSELLRGLPEAKGDFRYETGKWSIKELFGHIIDTERVFAYRGLVFARNDSTPLPGFDQDPWSQYANYANLKLSDIAAEFDAVRRSSIHLFRNLDQAAWSRKGIANKNGMTVRAAAFIIGGHTQHHLDILNSRYLQK